ncbi:YbhB/YbcL family Raf kinase inhibitor-like protein [Candidatus Parcubacteria bacterium]|nr:MAG: YbhB/YbcL family Raf kinase inhibitor-like protein [Candidatus Parcubacteria bacterium]
MLLLSPAFRDGEYIPLKYTCDGSDINPPLEIQNVPSAAKSLALIVDDPDAVGGVVFTHWLVWNIAPSTSVIKEESVPPGASEGINDGGKVGYMGPCPPDTKPHRYRFRLFALSHTLSLPEHTSKDALEAEIRSCVLEEAELIGLYQRQT